MSESIDTLRPRRCEIAVTRPPMFLGLPSMLSSLVIMLSLMVAILIYSVDDVHRGNRRRDRRDGVGRRARASLQRPVGLRQLLRLAATDLRSRQRRLGRWGGAKLCALPLSAAPLRG